MKKILSLLLSLCMVLSLSSCGTSSPKQEAQKEQPQSSQAEQSKDSQENQAQQETPSSKTSLTIGDEAVSGDCAIVIDSLRFGKNTDGNKVVVVNYTYKNNNEEKTQSALSSTMIKVFQDGVELENAIMSEGINVDNHFKDLRPGKSIDNCEQGFVLTSETSPLEIEFSSVSAMFTEDPVLITADLPQE